MLELGPATEHEMVLAFVRAEVDSVRFSPDYQGLDRHTLIDSADLESASQNEARLQALNRAKGGLIQGLLGAVTWRRVALERTDIPRLKYLNHRDWIEFSGGTRLVSDGAKNIGSRCLPSSTNAQILPIAKAFENGSRCPELIAAAVREDIVLVEGHTRATAYTLAGWPMRIDCILGASPTTHRWDGLNRR